MKRARAGFLLLLAVSGGVAGYCFYQQQQEFGRAADVRARRQPVYKMEEKPDSIPAGKDGSGEHFMAKTRFRILRSSALDGIEAKEQARLYAARLEEDLLRMRTWVEALRDRRGEQLIADAAELCVSNATLQKLYPEYQTQVASRQSALKAGYGSEHPRIKALDQSIAAMRQEFDQASELCREQLEIQCLASQKMLEGARARANSDNTIDAWLQTQVKVISSPAVLSRAVKHLNLDTRWKLTAQQAVARVEENMEVELPEGTNVVSLTVRDFSKSVCVDIANAVRNAYEEVRKEAAAAPPPLESRYESSMMLLQTIRELSALQKVEQKEEKPVEIVETAR